MAAHTFSWHGYNYKVNLDYAQGWIGSGCEAVGHLFDSSSG